MQLRWLIKSAHEIDYASDSLQLIQSKLWYNQNNKVLQMLVHINCPERGLGNYWVDIPVVEEMVDD